MTEQRIDGELLKKMFITGAKNLERKKAIVDELNVFPVPDGDTGTNMSMTIANAAEELTSAQNTGLHSVAKTAASGALIGARGNSGVILSQLLRGVAEGCKDRDSLDIEGVALIVRKAADAAYKAVMKPIEGTILTVAREMAEYAMDHYQEYGELEQFVKAVMAQGNDALSRTPEMLPVLKEAGVVDSGGQGLMFIVEGAYMALTHQDLEEDDALKTKISARERFVDDSGMRSEDIRFGYCTEFIIKNAEAADENDLREYLNSIGDCVLVIKAEDIIKVHVHTDHPGQAFERGLTCGDLTRMKVDNMRELFGIEKTENKDEPQTSVSLQEKTELEEKPYSFVAVSPGKGLEAIFRELGIDGVISGGQTMNPSTQDFLNQIEELTGKEVFLFPNNSNIIMAAEQAKAISNRHIHVIPTKSVPQCISAMFAFDPDNTPEGNEATMTGAIDSVRSGEVTYAVRDTKMNGLKIKKGDIMGIFGGEIVAEGKDVDQVTLELIEKMWDEDMSLITLYYGEDVPPQTAEALGEILEERFEDCDIEVHEGGQPLYYYFISVE